jgi:hypothetical protein
MFQGKVQNNKVLLSMLLFYADMFEYFVFCLASAATMIPDLDPRVKDKKESYTQLALLYLEFFLPTFVHQSKEMFSTPTKNSNLRSREPIKATLPLYTNVFNSKYAFFKIV